MNIVKNRGLHVIRICLMLFFMIYVTNMRAITLKVGETYTCNIGYVSHLQSTFWTSSAPDCLEITSSLTGYNTSVTVRAIKAFSSRIVVQCHYYWLELDPISGLYIYSRNTYKDWTFSIEDDGPDRVSMYPTNLTLDVGDSYNLVAEVTPSTANQTLTWSCYPSGIVSVSNGYVYAKASGNATITATAVNGVSASCYVTVRSILPTSVSIPNSLTTFVGETSKLSVSLYPSNAQSSVSWYSSNSNVASVSSGTVTGKEEGTANVYVTTANGLRSNDCVVTVKYRVPTGISISNGVQSLPIGHSRQLSATVTPSNARYTQTWSSDKSDVVEVSISGLIKAKKEGTARITVRTDNGYSATCTVTVPPMPERLELPVKVALQYGKLRTLKCTAEPSDAYLSLTWSSDNTDVVTVSQQGVITACGAGEATISVVAEGGAKAACKVYVEEPKHCFIVWTKDGAKVVYLMKDHPVVTHEDGSLVLTTRNVRVEYPEVQVRKFTLEDQTTDPYPTEIDLPEVVTLQYKQTQALDYQLYPADFDIETRLTWKSSAPHIVSVDQTGKVLARCNGEAVVSVTASNGATDACLVMVPDVPLYLVVWTTDGGRALYPLNEQPAIKQKEGCFTVRTSVMEVEYPVSDVRMFTLADSDDPKPEEPMDLSGVMQDCGYAYDGEEVRFSSLRPGSKVSIYNVSGVLLLHVEVTSSGTANIPLGELPKGIYIIQSDSITHKIIKK